MPASIIVGGQYGSEGKGKVAQHYARLRGASAAVRVGGSNSGHTTLGSDQERQVFRHLPTAALEPNVLCVLAAGSYIDLQILAAEMQHASLPRERLVIDPNAMIITDADREAEQRSGLIERIGSTGSGTGAAVARRIARGSRADLAGACQALAPYLAPTRELLRGMLDAGEHVIIEGTQGFGLSVLHSPHFPHATSRDTTAAGALSETGLSPLDVGEVVLVLRALPIRVAGPSGPFGAQELDWMTVAVEGGHDNPIEEHTSVTKRVRRVARFDPLIVRNAIAANNPSTIVLNHLDHVDAAATERLTPRAQAYIARVQSGIGRQVDLAGLGPDTVVAVSERQPIPA